MISQSTMRIRAKFIFVVVPLIITPLLLVGLAASLAARNGITRIATEFVQFKSEELNNYANTQWNLLLDNELSGREEFVSVSKSAVGSFARSLIRSDGELILAVDEQGKVVMSTENIDLSEQESARLSELASSAEAAAFEPFVWMFLVTEERDIFYSAVNQIFFRQV